MSSLEEDLTKRAKRALGHWGLPDQVPQLLKYRENAVFRVTFADGGKAALRLHRPGYHSRAALMSELTWMADLRRQGVLVPEPIPYRDGGLLVAIDTGSDITQYADMIGWVEGDPLGESGRPLGRSRPELGAVFGAIGEQMARMHVAADGFHVPADFERPSWNEAGLLGDKPFWGRFWDCDGLDADDRAFLVRLRHALTRRLDAVSPSLDKGLIHADLVRENVFVNDGAVAFIDFDDCGFGFRLFDVATALLRNRREPDYPAMRDALLRSYAAVRPAMEEEFKYLPLFLLLRSLTYIGWAGARSDLPDSEERLKRYVAEARDLAARLENA
ncbi:phosphotransferase [Rhizobium sp. TH2]|uniref:phosphotransferase enzyme family protein n=1 Tax=Rhizobium sp. TH2 TaxID=2775403 RepID=UPI0021588800|nr:phosphotransferase [Rhizobium sp. TH2]UVC08005.1 phosphotransferase [Rhizobium sp. TH2]